MPGGPGMPRAPVMPGGPRMPGGPVMVVVPGPGMPGGAGVQTGPGIPGGTGMPRGPGVPGGQMPMGPGFNPPLGSGGLLPTPSTSAGFGGPNGGGRGAALLPGPQTQMGGTGGVLLGPATGLAMSELILDGRAICVDLTPFDPTRL